MSNISNPNTTNPGRPPNIPRDVFKKIQMKPRDQCWPWLGGFSGRDKRPYFDLNGKKLLAYRLVYELVTGEAIPDGKLVRHSCDNGSEPIGCCNPHHLSLGNHEDNMRDMRNRARHGITHHAVRAIRKAHENGITNIQIAKNFGISVSNVSAIINRRTFKDVPDSD